MHDLAILFVYHKDDVVTRYHLELIKNNNPGVPVVLIADNIPNVIEGSHDISDAPEFPFKNAKNAWRNLDFIIYRWFLHRKIDAERYIILEWDCLCTTPLRSYYKEVWDKHVACARPFYLASHSSWYWFSYGENAHFEPKSLLAGVCPFAGTFVSHEALSNIVKCLKDKQGPDGRPLVETVKFCETRFGTTANYLGYPIEVISEQAEKQIFAHQWANHPNQPGLYHSVKVLPSGEQ